MSIPLFLAAFHRPPRTCMAPAVLVNSNAVNEDNINPNNYFVIERE